MMKILSISTFALALLSVNDVSAAISGWTQKADFGSHGRHRGVGIAIGNKGYMGMGHYNGAGPNIVLKDWWEYDPANGTWTQKTDYIGNGGNGTYAPLTFGMDNLGFIGGGQVATSNDFFKYDPSR
jgi:N-acetylneuraminic acid mutarotase